MAPIDEIDEIDLEHEHQKLKDRLAVVDEAIKKKKLADVEKETKLRWQEKNVQEKCIIFNSDYTSSSGSEDEDDLDHRVKLAQENVELLMQRGAIKKLSKKIGVQGRELKDIQELISTKEGLLSNAADKDQAFATVLEKVQLLCRPDQELVKAMKLVEARDHEISTLQDSNNIAGKRLKERLAEVVALKLTIEEQEIVNDHQQSLIVTLPVSLKNNELLKEDNAKSTIQNMEIAYQKGRVEGRRELVGLANAGRYIRGRKLEWQSSSANNDTLVALGNKASHYGMALADASLYQDTCPGKRSDTSVFVGLYGVTPEFVWKNRYSEKILEILDWRGSLKDFHSHRHTGGSYESTKFCQLSRSTFASFLKEPNIWNSDHFTKFFEEEEGKTLYEALKEYMAGLNKHTAYIKQQKDGR